jgi:membrane protein YdbS with pleckstrin-like domain
MLELIKLLVDGVVLRDGARKGMLTWRVVAYAVAFVVLLYSTGLPAVLYYQTHPSYKPLFIAAIVFDAVLFLAYMYYGWRWYFRQLALQRSKANTPSD